MNMVEHTKPVTPVTPYAAPVNEAAAKRQAEETQKATEKNRSEAIERLDADEKARVDAINETAKRQSESKPTPTQRENDLAKLGLLDLDAKEDDGSGPEPIPGAIRRDASAEDAAKYRTREMNKK